jgi:hypothetical protein
MYLITTCFLSIRYIPLLKETFMFPQSLGILGGKPGTSTYIAGVQDDRALYLDPHEVQMVNLHTFYIYLACICIYFINVV